MKQAIITALLALVTIAGQAQTSFDPEEGCLNVVDVSYSQGIGELLLFRPQVLAVC